jgi:glutathione S-transferase
MRTLYHFKLSPFSRKVRVVLKEKQLDFELIDERYWERRREFLAMNPAAQVPVLVEEGMALLSDSVAITEYLEEKYPEHSMLGKTIMERAEARRLSGWFNNKFYYEVTRHVLHEKVIKHYQQGGSPSSEALKVSRSNIAYHLDYIAYLLQQRQWLAGEFFSQADITAASQLSVLDYLGEVPWNQRKEVKDWYAIVKSRPSFRPLLKDNVPGFAPPAHYRDLDF